MEDQGRFTRYARFTSSDATDGSPIAITFCKAMEVSTSRMMLGVYRHGYGSLTKLYTVNGHAMIEL